MTSYFSLTMLGLILPGTAVAYQVIPRRARWAVLLAASYVTFWAISGKLLAFLLASTVTIWLCGLALDREIKQRGEALRAPGANRKAVKQSYARRMRLIMAAGAAVNLGMLFAFKYVVFAHRLLAPLAAPLLTHLGIGWAAPAAIAAPIGISFYTLQAVSYLVDVYRQSVTADRNLCRLALFMAFFPQIMEGPICRYGQTAQALWAGHGITWENLVSGSQRILWGAAKKLIVADRVNLLVKTVFASYESYDGGIIALAAVLYTIQLYCDFSGTMDFVVGTGRIFGVRLPENFRQPFFSRTASEFWQRWHITLGTWFRDYVFYPVSLSKPVKRLTTSARHLLGNRMGPVAASGVALLAVWLGNGLWHGAGGQYVLFGLFWFAVIWLGGFAEPIAQSICERLGIDRSALPYRAFQHARTLAIVFCGELIFRADGGWAALGMLRRLFGQFSLASFADGTVLKLGMDGADFACVGIAIAVLFVVGLLRERAQHDPAASATPAGHAGMPAAATANTAATRFALAWWQNFNVRWVLGCALILAIVVFGAYGTGYVPVDPMYASF